MQAVLQQLQHMAYDQPMPHHRAVCVCALPPLRTLQLLQSG
jgi:hypothetical protein